MSLDRPRRLERLNEVDVAGSRKVFVWLILAAADTYLPYLNEPQDLG